MAKKVVTMSLEEDTIDKLTKGGEIRFSDAISKLVSYRESEKKVRLMDIRGIFTSAEWMALAAGLNGTLIDDFSRYSRDMFVAHNEDAEKYEGCFSQFGVKVDEVNAKIARLTHIQIATTYQRITDFWENQRGAGEEFEKWADF